MIAAHVAKHAGARFHSLAELFRERGELLLAEAKPLQALERQGHSDEHIGTGMTLVDMRPC